MKRIPYILIALACLLCSCSREHISDPGLDGNSQYRGAYTRAYLQQIADNLVIHNLQAMEKGLALYSPDIWQKGAKFIVSNEELDIKGAEIIKAEADSTWTIKYSGDFPINYTKFPTEYVMTIRMKSQPKSSSHFGWIVRLEGSRTEDKGFFCSFHTDGTMDYTPYNGTYTNWGQIHGTLLLSISRNGRQIDYAMPRFNGPSSNPYYTNQL